MSEVKAPMPAKVISVLVKVGDHVNENDEIAMIEAMKMEMPIVSNATGRVSELHITQDKHVEAGAVMAVIQS